LITEVKLTETCPIVRIKETDRKVVILLKVVVKAPLDGSILKVELIDEKELCFYSKSIIKDITSDVEYEMTINEQFQVNNHLSIGIISDGNAEFDVAVHIG